MTIERHPREPQAFMHSMNIGGNLHDVPRLLNKFGWAEFLVAADYTGGAGTILLLRFPIGWPCDDRGPLPAMEFKKP